MKRLQRLHLVSRADMLKPLRVFIRSFLGELDCNAETLDCLVLAINEGCMNVIQHAYNGATDKEIIVEFWKEKAELMVRILDSADVVDVSLIKSRALDDIRPGGLGVHIINQVMDKVEYKHRPDMPGNMLEMRKNLNAPTACNQQK